MPVNKLLNIAKAELNYQEKESNKQLDDKFANSGNENYTKYARDLDNLKFYNGRKQSAAWCDVFVDWCFVKAFGKDAALKMLYQPTVAEQNCGAGCGYSYDYYKKNGRIFSNPKPGDQIFFYNKNKNKKAHTGLVYKVDDKKVYTLEGNTSNSSGIVSNGGSVCEKAYMLTNSRIAGYGRPNYGHLKSKETAKEVIKMRTLRVNCKGTQVKILQWLLNEAGYACDIDGVFGSKTKAAVKEYQKANNLEADGIVGEKTWAKLVA